jgi:hypothetical protein
LTATNNAGSGTGVFTLTVPNFIPAVAGASLVVPISSTVMFQISANNYPTTYSAANLPAGLVLNTNTGLISGIISNYNVATYLITISASNADGIGGNVLSLKNAGFLSVQYLSASMTAGGGTIASFLSASIDGRPPVGVVIGTTYTAVSSFTTLGFLSAVFNQPSQQAVQLYNCSVGGNITVLSNSYSTANFTVSCGIPGISQGISVLVLPDQLQSSGVLPNICINASSTGSPPANISGLYQTLSGNQSLLNGKTFTGEVIAAVGSTGGFPAIMVTSTTLYLSS